MMLRLWMLASALVGVGCGADAIGGIADETDSLIAPPDEPAGAKVGLGDECLDSSNCQSGLCAAPWNGEGAALVCVDTCVDTNDETRWCADDAVCCEPDAVCGSRGLCLPAGAVDETGTAGSTGGTGTGTGTAGSTGGTATDTGTDTEAAGSTRGGGPATGSGSTGASSTGTG